MCESTRIELLFAILCALAAKSFSLEKIAVEADIVNQAWEPQKETTTFSEATTEYDDPKDLEAGASSHFVYMTRPLPLRRQDGQGSFGQKLVSMLDTTSYRGYLRRAYPGIIPAEEANGNNTAFDETSNIKYRANPSKPSRRFFFSGNPFGGLFGGYGDSSGYYGDDEPTKDRCQFVPYQQYNNFGGIGFNGGFPYGANYHSGELQQHGHHYEDEAAYGPASYDYLQQKRDVITSRQGFLADDGYGGHYDDYGGEEHGGGHQHHKGKVHPLGYYYCKKGHCGIDGYCTKKTPEYHRRPVQSLHYHRRPHYTKHHFYNEGHDQGTSYHHHQGDYEHVGDYHPELPY